MSKRVRINADEFQHNADWTKQTWDFDTPGEFLMTVIGRRVPQGDGQRIVEQWAMSTPHQNRNMPPEFRQAIEDEHGLVVPPPT